MKLISLASAPSVSEMYNPLFKLIGWPLRVAGALEKLRLHHKQRMQFARTDARTLRDLGISHSRRFIELNNPY